MWPNYTFMESFPKKVTTELRSQRWLGIYQAKQREEVQKTCGCGSGGERVSVWLCDPMECSLPGSSVHGILQAKVLEWVALRPSLLDLLPLQIITVHSAELPGLYSRFSLVVYFIHSVNSVCVPIPVSQIQFQSACFLTENPLWLERGWVWMAAISVYPTSTFSG